MVSRDTFERMGPEMGRRYIVELGSIPLGVRDADDFVDLDAVHRKAVWIDSEINNAKDAYVNRGIQRLAADKKLRTDAYKSLLAPDVKPKLVKDIHKRITQGDRSHIEKYVKDPRIDYPDRQTRAQLLSDHPLFGENIHSMVAASSDYQKLLRKEYPYHKQKEKEKQDTEPPPKRRRFL